MHCKGDEKIFYVLGKIVYQGTGLLPLQIDIHSFPTGIYNAVVLLVHNSFSAAFDVIH